MIAPIASISVLHDLTLQLRLPPQLDHEVKVFCDYPQARLTDEEWGSYVATGVSLAERCAAYLDGEIKQLTEARFSAPDSITLRQKLIADPRRQVDQIVSQIRQKIDTERQEWGRRIVKQLADVSMTIEQHIESMTVVSRADGGRVAPGDCLPGPSPEPD